MGRYPVLLHLFDQLGVYMFSHPSKRQNMRHTQEQLRLDVIKHGCEVSCSVLTSG